MFSKAAYDLVDIIYEFSSFITANTRPSFLVNQTVEDSGEEGCEEGGFEMHDNTGNGVKNGLVVLDYRECLNNGVTIDGRMNYEVRVKNYGYETKLTINQLNFRRHDDEIIVSGVTSQEPFEGVASTEFMILSKTLGYSVKVENLTIVNGVVTAKIFHSDYGFVLLNHQHESKQFSLSGNEQTKLTVGYEGVSLDSNEDFQFELEFIDQFIKLETQISVSDLFYWPYNENRPPVLTTSLIIEQDRLATEELLGQASDSDSDFLSYEWTHISSPTNCEYQLVHESAVNSFFTSECQGVHEIQISVTDGFNVVDEVLKVNVIPLPASIEPVGDIKISSLENLHLGLVVNNLNDDGPFDFSLAYSPKGVEIDQNGVVTGKPVPFVSGSDESFKIAVDVDNGRKSRIEFTVEQNGEVSQKKLVANMANCYADKAGWHDIDGDGNVNSLCKVNKSYMLLELRGNEISTEYTELNPLSFSELVSLTHTDINQDDVNEIILGYENEIFVVNGETKEVVKSFALPFSTESPYYRRYELHPLTYGYSGLMVEVIGGEDEGFYLIDFEDDGSIEVTFLDYFRNVDFIGNADADILPELINVSDKQIIDISGSAQNISVDVDHLIDMDGDGDNDLVTLTNFGDYYSDEFTLKIYDATSKELLVDQIIALPEQYTDIWRPASFIVNVDSDTEKEIILHFGSIHSFFVFQKHGDSYNLDQTISIPEESNNFLPTFRQITDSKILITLGDFAQEYYSYSVDDGFGMFDVKSPSYSTHSVDLYGMSVPKIIRENELQLFYKDNFSVNKLGKLEIDSQGEIVSLIKTNIPAPHILSSTLVSDISAPDQNEILISKSHENGYRVYDIDTEQLVIETTFDTEMKSDSIPIKTDVDNDGISDILSYNSGYVPFNWIDPVVDEEKWVLELDKLEYYPKSRPTITGDIDSDGKTDLITILNHKARGNELHIFSYNGTELETTFTYQLESTRDIGYHISLGLQDIDGDRKPEIIIIGYDSDCFDDDLKVLSQVETDSCLTDIPTMTGNYAKKNIIASGPANSLTIRSTSTVNAYSHFIELDALTGTSIWNSSAFFGRLDPRSLTFFEEDPYISRKAAVFQFGLYTF